jgi:hypothetical protein
MSLFSFVKSTPSTADLIESTASDWRAAGAELAKLQLRLEAARAEKISAPDQLELFRKVFRAERADLIARIDDALAAVSAPNFNPERFGRLRVGTDPSTFNATGDALHTLLGDQLLFIIEERIKATGSAGKLTFAQEAAKVAELEVAVSELERERHAALQSWLRLTGQQAGDPDHPDQWRHGETFSQAEARRAAGK